MNELVKDLIIIFSFQILFMAAILLCSAFYKITTHFQKKLSVQFESELLTAIKEKDANKEYSAACMQLRVIVPILESYEDSLKGMLWKTIKERIIHLSLRREIEDNLKRRNWVARSWAVRALNLSPKVEDEHYFIENLAHPNDFVKTLAIKGALQIQTVPAVKGVLEGLREANEQFEFPYLDHLIKAEEPVWDALQNIYDNHPDLQIFALKVLGEKTGYIHLEGIEKFLHSENQKESKIAINALKNIPSEKSVAILKELLDAKDNEKKLLAIYILGKLRVRDTERYRSLLNDPDSSIRLAAGWALSLYGESLEGSDVNEYIQGFPVQEIEHSLAALTRTR